MIHPTAIVDPGARLDDDRRLLDLTDTLRDRDSYRLLHRLGLHAEIRAEQESRFAALSQGQPRALHHDLIRMPDVLAMPRLLAASLQQGQRTRQGAESARNIAVEIPALAKIIHITITW